MGHAGRLGGLRDLSLFIATIYFGGLVFQYPIGWLSDRMDRRRLMLAVAAVGVLAMLPPSLTDPGFSLLLVIGLVVGGVANSLYSLLLAHTNDFLDKSEMAGASGRSCS